MKKSLILIILVSLLFTATPFAVFAANAKLGDINANGEIDSTDYILLKRAYFSTYTLTEDANNRADINANNEIDSMDYILLKRAYFGTYTIITDNKEEEPNTDDTKEEQQPSIGATEEEQQPHTHSWNEATCSLPKTCSECGEAAGNVAPHNYVTDKCTYCGLETLWTYENGGIDTIVATRDGIKKTIKINIDHLPQPYENEDGSYGRLGDVSRDSIYGYGDWIFYIESYSFATSGGSLSGSSRVDRDCFRIKTDGTQQIKTNDIGAMPSKLHIVGLIGIYNGDLYYFLGEGMEMAGIPEYEYLYKIKVEDNITDLISQGTLVSEVDFDQSWLIDTYIQDEWIYYTIYDSQYKMKLDGTENQLVEN